MSIQMIGTDYEKALIGYRELFSLSESEISDFISFLQVKEKAEGCVILSTCNRTEIWINSDKYVEDIDKALCKYKKLDYQEYKDVFVERRDERAVKHLFYLAGGIKSKILGDDQIITQVKESLNVSRKNNCTGKVLGALFEEAITAGKKVKTHVNVPKVDISIVSSVINEMKNRGESFLGKKCLVIGNGIMGKMVAQQLLNEGAEVTVTVRKYKHDAVTIPDNCSIIDYVDRIPLIPKFDVILSATTSPNYTIKCEEINFSAIENKLLCIDLAVPRDIDPKIGSISKIDLFNIDDFNTERNSFESEEYIKQAKKIILDHIQKYATWYKYKDTLPSIKTIADAASSDAMLRMKKTLKTLPDHDQQMIEVNMEKAVEKMMNKLLFSLRTQVNSQVFFKCIEGLETVVEQEKSSDNCGGK